MFIIITIKDQKGKELDTIINTNQIAFIADLTIHMSNGAWFDALPDSMQRLKDELWGLPTEPSVEASTKTVELLNELNTLARGQGTAKPTTDRKARLRALLKDFSADELKLAAKNLGEDEFMQGDNDRHKRYGTIDWLLRKPANVNRYLEEQTKKKKSMF